MFFGCENTRRDGQGVQVQRVELEQVHLSDPRIGDIGIEEGVAQATVPPWTHECLVGAVGVDEAEMKALLSTQ